LAGDILSLKSPWGKDAIEEIILTTGGDDQAEEV
jgi:hypothetical protein